MPIEKIPLSGSTNGKPIKMSSISDTTIHVTGTSASVQDSLYIYAYCSNTASGNIRFRLGDGGGSLDNTSFVVTVPAKGGSILTCFEGIVFTGDGSTGTTITGRITSGTGTVNIVGFVNRVS